jgi:hypothetical protein
MEPDTLQPASASVSTQREAGPLETMPVARYRSRSRPSIWLACIYPVSGRWRAGLRVCLDDRDSERPNDSGFLNISPLAWGIAINSSDVALYFEAFIKRS